MDKDPRLQISDEEIERRLEQIRDFAENGPRMIFNDQGGWKVDPLEILVQQTMDEERNQ